MVNFEVAIRRVLWRIHWWKAVWTTTCHNIRRTAWKESAWIGYLLMKFGLQYVNYSVYSRFVYSDPISRMPSLLQLHLRLLSTNRASSLTLLRHLSKMNLRSIMYSFQLLGIPFEAWTNISVLFHAIHTDIVDESWQTISHSLKEVYSLSGASKSFKTIHALCGRLSPM